MSIASALGVGSKVATSLNAPNPHRFDSDATVTNNRVNYSSPKETPPKHNPIPIPSPPSEDPQPASVLHSIMEQGAVY